jgi:hypothetical protein
MAGTRQAKNRRDGVEPENAAPTGGGVDNRWRGRSTHTPGTRMVSPHRTGQPDRRALARGLPLSPPGPEHLAEGVPEGVANGLEPAGVRFRPSPLRFAGSGAGGDRIDAE